MGRYGTLPWSNEQIAAWVEEARDRTLGLVVDLTDAELMGPQLDTVNPLLWEIGHVAWFQDRFVLRRAARREPLHADADTLYDSSAVAHATRWSLPLFDRRATVQYLLDAKDACVDHLLDAPRTEEQVYGNVLAVFHEDMHCESFTWTRQTQGWPAPRVCFDPSPALEGSGDVTGDVRVPGGTWVLGASPEDPFVFDNEKWAHEVEIAPFSMAKTVVTRGSFAAFMQDGGYRQREFWDDEGWAWREAVDAQCPVYWRNGPDGWRRRVFNEWVTIQPHRPMVHANWHEARAYCKWAGRRLPTEAEWDMAARWDPSGTPRRYPWGSEPDETRVNMDWRFGGTVDVGALPAGDSALGLRQMLGNVWEWTSSPFEPFPGFEADPYEDYSVPSFGKCKVLRGGSWAARSRMVHSAYRNYFAPERRDVFAGFRTVAV